MTFSPYPGFDPCDGAEPHVELSRDNPFRVAPLAILDGPNGMSREPSHEAAILTVLLLDREGVARFQSEARPVRRALGRFFRFRRGRHA
jgi:hypothetical protein